MTAHQQNDRNQGTHWLRLNARDVLIIGLIAGLLGLLFLIFHRFGVSDVGYFFKSSTTSLFTWMHDRWLVDFYYTRFAYGQWVPLVSLALVWMDRRTLARLPCAINYYGLLFILFGFLLHWAGLKSEQTRLSIVSLIVLIWSFPLFLCGWAVARRLLFPCGFLLLSIPLNFFDALTHPLRMISAAITSGLTSGLGIDVSRTGPFIFSNHIEGLNVNMADSCGSIFAYTAVAAYSLLCAYVVHTSPKKRALILASGIPLLMLANIIRAIMILVGGTLLNHGLDPVTQSRFSGLMVVIITFGGITYLAFIVHLAGTRLSGPRPPDAAVTRENPAPGLVVSLIFTGLAAWWIPSHSTVVHEEESGVNIDLPRAIGSWEGGFILYCHNPEHRKDYLSRELKPGDPCPSCGFPLQEMAEYEKRLLPPDTLIRKNWYEIDQKRRVVLSIVLSGKYRSSIHRPEVCLVGDGSQILRSFIHPVPLQDGRNLNVKILEMLHTRTGADGEPIVLTTYYAYWFAGINRETPHHLQRMAWMASDRLFKNRSYRWAYLSLSGGRNPGNTDYLAEVDAFIRLAYPYLIKK